MRTIRAEFGDRRPFRRVRARAYLQFLFLIAGLLAIDYYIWVSTRATVSQAYDHWSFTQQLQGRPVSIGAFLGREIDALLGRRTRPVEIPQAAKQRPRPATRPEPQPLAVIGRLEIPRLSMNLMVLQGVSDEALQTAVGHVPSTALPGQVGNVALAAHRDTFFRPLRNIRTGDIITLQTLDGSYQYAVKSIQIVLPSDTQVLNASNHPELTLITCYPFYYVGSAPKRFIVRASQLGPVRGTAPSVRTD
jgi:sortase A